MRRTLLLLSQLALVAHGYQSMRLFGAGPTLAPRIPSVALPATTTSVDEVLGPMEKPGKDEKDLPDWLSQPPKNGTQSSIPSPLTTPEAIAADRALEKMELAEAKLDKLAGRQQQKKKRSLRFWRREPAIEDSSQVLGDVLEKGWEQRGARSSFKRNVEVWGFALRSVIKVLKANKSGDTEKKVAAAEFVRDGLLRLGPTFVKLGQVISTRTDVLSPEFVNALKSLQDEVPGFSGSRAKEIVAKELGKPIEEIFSSFSEEPLAAASLGQVHRATLKDGREVAVKVQRANLKELFDVDLKNLKKLAVLLDKIDPKSDGADREWAAIYDESQRLLYKEIDYLNEADNAARFKNDFASYDWVKVPECYLEYSTPRVLTMEFVESFKLTDIPKVENEGLDRELLAKRTADSFLRQIIETGFFHCDPHPGNLAVNKNGQLVYYDFGMMNELRPNVQEGFREFCKALFEGGPLISDIDLARNAKRLVTAVEKMGVLSKSADRLAVEKLARFFMRSFKNTQLGKQNGNIKETLGKDLQTLTDDKGGTVFKFPPAFTFIFRAFASIEGIGKGLDKSFDIGKLSQPFVEAFIKTEDVAQAGSEFEQNLGKLGKATGLNLKDVNIAVTQPRRVRYLEETLRSMEEGNLKIRVRSLENEAALDRLAIQTNNLQSLLAASVLLNAAIAIPFTIPTVLCYAGAAGAAGSALSGLLKLKIYDKKQSRYTKKSFIGEDEEEEQAEKAT